MRETTAALPSLLPGTRQILSAARHSTAAQQHSETGRRARGCVDEGVNGGQRERETGAALLGSVECWAARVRLGLGVMDGA